MSFVYGKLLFFSTCVVEWDWLNNLSRDYEKLWKLTLNTITVTSGLCNLRKSWEIHILNISFAGFWIPENHNSLTILTLWAPVVMVRTKIHSLSLKSQVVTKISTVQEFRTFDIQDLSLVLFSLQISSTLMIISINVEPNHCSLCGNCALKCFCRFICWIYRYGIRSCHLLQVELLERRKGWVR